jgi:dolichol kinase
MTMMPSVSEQPQTTSYRSEIGRKSVHFLSALTPVIYCFIDRRLALSILIPIAVAILVIDILRQVHPGLRAFYSRHWGHLMRGDELGRLCGASHVVIASVLSIVLFPKPIAITALLFMSVSDALASLVGMRSKGPRWMRASLAGSTAFLVSALVIAFIFLHDRPLAAVLGAVAGTIIEALPLGIGKARIDDNITVPLGAGLVMWALSL